MMAETGAPLSKREEHCRSCGSSQLDVFLDLGMMPLADRLVADPGEEEPRFPLEVAFCHDCALVQILETVEPTVLFGDDYPYFSSFSPALVEHAKRNCTKQIGGRKLDSSSFVVEVASNDGYLLKTYVEEGIPALGVEPTAGPAKAALEAGVPTEVAFFTKEFAEDLASRVGKADVIHGNNVLAHVADTNGFVSGLAALLKPGGVAVIEMPYLKHLIDNVEFDTIYHEHLCYFSLTSLDALFRRHGLFINDVEQLSIHGGSLRIYAEPHEAPSAAVTDLLAQEKETGLDRFSYFVDFANRVDGLRHALKEKLSDLRRGGARIAAYGAAAKGATMLNYCEIGSEQLEFVADRNTHKQGKYMPGCGLRIDDATALDRHKPDYVLLLAWNFADEILKQQQAYSAGGGQFIVPVPEVRIV